jgi:hypothetical protein
LPLNVMSELVLDSIVITWTAPNDGGSAITSYKILLRTNLITEFIENT